MSYFENQKIRSSYSKGLEQIRGLACLMVWVYHGLREIFGLNEGNIFSREFNLYLGNGEFAVVLFFILSGFLFSLIYGDRDKPIKWGSFIKKRCFRILPVYLILVISVAALNYETIDSRFTLNFLTILPLTYIGLGGGSGALHIWSVWSISVEFCFYLLCPFFLNVYLNKGNLLGHFQLLGIVLIFSIFLYGVYFYSSGENHGIYQYTLLGHLGQFLIGMLAADLWIRFYKTTFKLRFLFLMILIVSWYFLVNEFTINFFYLRYIYWSFTAIIFIITFAIFNGLPSFIGYPLEFLGKISYSMYLLCIPLQQFFSYFFKIPLWNNSSLFSFNSANAFLVTICTLFTVIISYYCVEKPFISLGKK